ncbi:carboxypeptidase regulatory-like domain-containing protein [Spirosoma soli]|uniref:Carboxypeptidase regulatory-like domain-containing protein n=1 Tax=Spirosoma soli TaxID=1770529 RepID=A0ABW5LZ53_9BACT
MQCRLLLVWIVICWRAWLMPYALGQTVTTTLTGHITDAATGKPLPFANVYLNGTTQGAATDAQGYFTLANVPLGTVEVVASFLGYQTERRTLRLDDPQAQTINFRLKPDDRTLSGVTVKARKKDKVWEKQLREFKREILGQPYGNQCLIVNNYVLEFTEKDGHLQAKATEPLIIENQALGYRLWYDLQYFDAHNGHVYYAGSTRFEDMPSTDERQANRFRRNRMTAYRGSLRHLMASLVAGTYEQEGFLVYQEDPTVPITVVGVTATLQAALNRHLLPLRLNEIIQPGKLAFERRLVSKRQLAVFYTKATSQYSPYRDARYAYSQLVLPSGQMQFTTDGWITSPNGMEVQGSLADDRLSTLLPADWKPSVNGVDPSAGGPTLAKGKLLPLDARMGRIRDEFTKRFRYLSPGVFVQVDKPFYATGDRLWLSAYLFDTPTHRLPIGETALHVDLLSPSGQLVQHQWLHVVDGRAVGDFRLSDTLMSGTYRLRAYTDEDEGQPRPAFERTIALYNLMQGGAAARHDTAQMLDVQLLPEGGRWVAGLPARLGIKALGPDGRGRTVSGRIVDSSGTEVAKFASNRFGMGNVTITPQSGRRYYAEIRGSSRKQLVPLPPAEPSGIVMSADVVSDSTQLLIDVASTSGSSTDLVYVLIQQRGQIVGQQKIQLEKGIARLTLPLATLPTGLNQITLYDGIAQPQAERLVFIPERLPPVNLTLTPNKARFQPREQVIINMNVNDDGQPAVATLSASITDAEQIPDDTVAATVQTHLLLTDELRGRVEEPNVYVKDNTLETRRALDNLLLTQGWRRVSGTPETDLLGGVSVTGRILNAKNEPIPGAQLVLASTVPNRSFVRSAGADERGHFRLAGLPIADTTQLIAQLTDRQFKDIPPKDARIELESVGTKWKPDTFTRMPNWAALKAQLDAAKIRQDADPNLYRDKTVTVLKEVTVRARKRDERPEDIRRMSLHNGADATILIDDNSPRFSNLYEMIQGRLPGVTVTSMTSASAGGGYQVIIRGIGTLQSGTSPLFLMDGMPVREDDSGTALLSFSPGDIERIELMKNGGTAGIYGVRGGNGVIAFYSKRFRPDQVDKKPKSGMMPLSVIGFPSVQREFYVPRYEGQPEETALVDRRDVLYWKPLIKTDANGQTRLMFPLSDVVRTLRVTVQGITNDGRPVTSVALIRVQ